MNNYIYPFIDNYQKIILDELNKINIKLIKIEKLLSKEDVNKENNYLENDDNYYMI